MSGTRAFRQSVNLIVSRHLSPQAQSARLAAFAKQELARALQGGASPEYQRFVDGRRGPPEEQVKPGGTILYRFNLFAIAAALALSELRKRSPVGHTTDQKRMFRQAYIDSFYLGLNGRFVLARNFNPRTAGELSNVVIGNTAPYARKVNVQFVGNRKLNYSVPPMFFREAAAIVQRRYPNLVVKDVYTVTFPGQYRLKLRQYRKGTNSHRIKRHTGELVESPAIIIKSR